MSIRLIPKAKATRFMGIASQTDNKSALKVCVTAAPERGKANAALIALLAKSWRLPKSAFTLSSGATDRRKTVHVSGDPDALTRNLENWMAKHHGS